MNFTGKITEISAIKSGETNGKEWASLEFEVTESNPNNELYPQIGSFGYFKNGEYTKYAKDFKSNFKIGDEVEVEFNLKCIKYKKDGVDKKFYKTECWKVFKADLSDDKTNKAVELIDGAFPPLEEPIKVQEEDDLLPF